MRRLAIFAACLWLLSQGAQAQVAPCGVVGARPYAEESITVSTTSIGFTSTVYNNGIATVAYARVQLQADSIYARDTGAAATNTAPVLSTTNVAPYFFVCGQYSVQRFQALRVTTDATLRVTYIGF